MPVPQHIKVTASGRICLFGEHQDFLGLPVIACAIDLAMKIVGHARPDSIFHLDMPEINQTDQFDAAEYIEYRHSRDYLRAAAFDTDLHMPLSGSAAGKLEDALQARGCTLAAGPEAREEIAPYYLASSVH